MSDRHPGDFDLILKVRRDTNDDAWMAWFETRQGRGITTGEEYFNPGPAVVAAVAELLERLGRA